MLLEERTTRRDCYVVGQLGGLPGSYPSQDAAAAGLAALFGTRNADPAGPPPRARLQEVSFEEFQVRRHGEGGDQ